jgi:hypothetical protein
MRLSNKQIKSLQALLNELYDLDYSDEQAQEAGLAIMRFVVAKAHRKHQVINMENNNYEKFKTTS